MIPKQAIEQAIEGGWDGHWDNVLGPIKHLGDRNDVGWEVVALDSAFWQALGKALDYDKDVKDGGTVKVYEGTWVHQSFSNHFALGDDWQNIVHDFLDLILTDGDMEKFWADLLN